MKASASVFTITLLLIAAEFTRAASPDLEYSFQRRDSASLLITVSFPANKIGSTLLHLPNEWAGQQMLYKAITELHPVSAGTSVAATDKPDEYLIKSAPDSRVTLTYVLHQDWEGPLKYPLCFRPVIGKDFFYFQTTNGLVYPNVADSLHVHCAISYKGFAKEDFIGNSFFANTSSHRFTVSLSNFLNGIYCGGRYRTKTVEADGHKITMAITGQFSFADEKAFSSVSTIIREERRFWHDAGSPYYFVAWLALDDQGTISGTAYYNSFVLFQSTHGKLSLDLLQTVSHEYFHNWLGGEPGLTPPEPRELYKWLMEGFTDYYSLKVLYATGILSKGDFMAQLNKNILEYYLSPAFRSENQELVGRYWEDRNLRLMGYRRGLTIAFVLDSRIAGKGPASLDDLMHDLFQRSKPTMVFSKAVFDQLVRQYADDSTLSTIDNANRGNNDLLTQDLLANKTYKTDTVTVTKLFDIGFDDKASGQAKRIIGLQPGSNAEKAGLRENMPITGGFSIWYNNTEKPAGVEVIRGGKKEWIQYIPVEAVNIPVPQIIFDGVKNEMFNANLIRVRHASK
jgi:predicted metalloprotease with PDZ domain